MALCRRQPYRRRVAVPHKSIPGSLGERDAVSSPGYEAGRRRAIGVVAALPRIPPRDHADGATLGRWDADASRRPRRPGMRAGSGAASGISDRGSGRGRDQRQRQKSGSASGTAPEANQDPRKSAPHRGAGFNIVPERLPGFAALPAQCHTGLPRGARCGLLFRPRGRPPALEQRGRSPSIHHPRDHAARATLVRWDARASRRARRPESRTASGIRVRDSVRNQGPRQRQESASGTLISDRCALLDPMFMVTSGSFRDGRLVDVKSDFKGMNESPPRRPLKSDFTSTGGGA